MDVPNSSQPAAATGDTQPSSASLFQNSRDFLAFIGLGISALFAHAILSGPGTQSVWFRTLPVWLLPLLICIFFGLGLKAGRHRAAESRQRFADNLYFLGFIFTMASLIATFLPAAWSQSVVINPRTIYSAFGTALISTALGLIFRVVVMQMAPSADEMSLQLEEDLTQLTASVASEARAIAKALADARGKIAQANEANIKSVLDAIAPRLEALVGEFGKATDDATALLRTQAEATRGDAEVLRLKVETQTNDITAAAKVLADARQGVSGALDGLSGPVTMLSNEVSEASTRAAETTSQLRTEIARLAASFATAADGSAKLLGAIDTMTIRTNEQTSVVDNAISGLSGAITAGTDRATLALTGAELAVGKVAVDATGFQAQIDASLAAFSRAVERFASELDSVRAEAAAPAAAATIDPDPPRTDHRVPSPFTPPPA